ncbi:MAG: hypothetical protein AVDCRST_MAG05-241, partial [uncultured Rubrobacteraceae bacterium]
DNPVRFVRTQALVGAPRRGRTARAGPLRRRRDERDVRRAGDGLSGVRQGADRAPRRIAHPPATAV